MNMNKSTRFSLIVLIASSILLSLGGVPYYKQGEWPGVIDNFSYKGFVIKSWEGSIVLDKTNKVPCPYMTSEIKSTKYFSANNKQIIDKLKQASKSGKRVTLYYTQWLITPINRETAFEIKQVQYTD